MDSGIAIYLHCSRLYWQKSSLSGHVRIRGSPGRATARGDPAQVMGLGGCWLVEVDIRKFFDTLDRAHLRELLRQRVRDGVLLRLIDKWLRAGAPEDGVLSFTEKGTPQGGVISPLLANVYLHYVLDVWFEGVVKPRLKGRAFLVRYADDLVLGFACEEDARRVLVPRPVSYLRARTCSAV